MNFDEVSPGFTEEQAVEEAKGCLSCKKPKCIEACPTRQNVPGYIAKIAEGDFKGALKIIMKDNPFPGTCGRVCPHPCQSNCIRGKKGTATPIAKLKRFVADNIDPKSLGIKPKGATGKKVCIVGSGPAGMSCAYYLALMGHEVRVRECNKDVGGMPAVAIPGFRLPASVVAREMDFIKSTGVAVEEGSCVRGLGELKNCDAIFLAIGAHNPRGLDVPGSGLDGVMFGAAFLKDVKRGKTPKVGKNVIIIGGGDVAIDASRTALRVGGKSVTIVYRRSEAEMPAYFEDIQEAEEEGVKFRYLASPVKIIGKDGKVSAVEFVENTLGECDDSGRCRPEPVEGSEFMLDADCVLLAIGQAPHLGLVADDKVLITERNTIAADALGAETAKKGVFAGGDCVTGPASIVDAIGAGKRAARAIDDYLKEN